LPPPLKATAVPPLLPETVPALVNVLPATVKLTRCR